MASERQYKELYEQNARLIKSHASAPLNAVRDKAYEDFAAWASLLARWKDISIRTSTSCSRPISD